MDGNGGNLDASPGILYYYYNNNATLRITNSIFRNFQVDISDSWVFNFYYMEGSSSGYDVEFDHVIFENIKDAYANSYGLIYVADHYDIKISNCKFRNNTGFVAMIHCIVGSNCQFVIEDSIFSNNNGGFYICMLLFFVFLRFRCVYILRHHLCACLLCPQLKRW